MFRAYCNTRRRDIDMKDVLLQTLDKLYTIVLEQGADSACLYSLFDTFMGTTYTISNRYGKTLVYRLQP
jgi:hypothetical protein